MPTIYVRVQPRASRNEVVREEGDAWWIRLAAPPLEGKANAALVDYLSRLLELPKNQVTIAGGQASRRKAVVIEGLSETEALHRLREALELRQSRSRKKPASKPLSGGSPGPAEG